MFTYTLDLRLVALMFVAILLFTLVRGCRLRSPMQFTVTLPYKSLPPPIQSTAGERRSGKGLWKPPQAYPPQTKNRHTALESSAGGRRLGRRSLDPYEPLRVAIL